MHLGEVVAVLAAQVAQQLAARAHLGEPLGVLVDRLGDVAQLGDDVVELGEQRRPGGRRRRANGARPADGRRAPRRARRGRRRRRRARRGPTAPASRCADGVGEQRPRRRSRTASSSGSSSAAASSSATWKRSRSISRARSRAVAAERGELGVELGQAGPRLRAAASRSTPPKRSRAARWVGPASRLWWSCWPCRSTSPAAASASAADRRRPPVDVGPRPPVGRDHPGQHELVVADDEAPVDPRLARAGAHDRGVGAAADEQLERLDEHRLAGAGLAGDARSCPGPRARSRRSMTPRFSMCSSVSIAQRSARPNLALRIWWKWCGDEAHEAGRLGRRAARHDVALGERGDELAVDGELGRAVARRPRSRPSRTGRARACGRTACAATPASAASPGAAATRPARGPTASRPSTRSAWRRSGRRRRSS